MVAVLIVVVTVALLMVAGLIALRLAMHAPRGYAGPDLGPYELALLAAGRFRVLNTALASLAADERVRIPPTGILTLTGSTSTDPAHPVKVMEPVEAEVLGLLEGRRDGLPVWEIKAALVQGAAVTALIARLEELGLVVAGDSRQVVPTRAGQAALAHYRLRHREGRSLPPRSRDHVTVDASNLFGVALYGLGQVVDRELATVLSMSGVLPSSGPARAGRR
ncbi:TIGR04222 domain-containing membrane protein [Streptosporangium sp. 'caverna']|uniref:TIGR04222 domain-containing membrane protein n=1 Tax=Streptosporangium sp. 'caverna' TaxID=2202249 RepID=UPI000D7D9F43|nr:TIGR04222 domain-containing membrane protein [Streptosporangium sp. 'caverna']AWS46777.1 hypothetical protein DKM19_41250 [Streptosporangium sp. 'caverna']